MIDSYSMVDYCGLCVFFFFKQKTAYEMRISDWSSDVCSSDLSAKLKYYSNLCCNNMLFDPRFASLLNCWKGRSTAARRAMARRNGERLVAATIDLTAPPTPQARPWWTHLYVQVLAAISSEKRRAGKEGVRQGRSRGSRET